MKKFYLLLSIVSVIILSSCTYNEVNDKTELPYSVMDSIVVVDSTALENVYVIETENNHFYFNENKKLVEKYITNNERVTLNIYFLITLFIVVFLVGLFLGDSY